MRYLIFKKTDDTALSTSDSGHFDFFLGRMPEVLFTTMYLKLSVFLVEYFMCKNFLINFKYCQIVVAIQKNISKNCIIIENFRKKHTDKIR